MGKSRFSNAAALMDAIRRKVPDNPPTQVEAAAEIHTQSKPRPRPSRRTAPATAPRNSGPKPAQFWFHEEDRRTIRELAAWVAGQGVRPSDSLILRAALHTTKTNQEFLEAYRQVSQRDGRLKAHKNE